MLVLSLRTENGLPVVKDHGKPDFVEPCRVRSSRKHRSFQKRTEPISTEPFLCKNKVGNVMVTSDIGLQNVKYSFSNHIRKCTYKNDHEGLGRSIRELAEHLYVTYTSLDLPPTQETWTTLTEEAQVMGRGELLEHWIASTKKFAEDIVTDSRTEMELPVSKEKKLKVDIDNYYLLYTDHQTYHRAQMNSLIKILGKDGVNTDYYSFLITQ